VCFDVLHQIVKSSAILHALVLQLDAGVGVVEAFVVVAAEAAAVVRVEVKPVVISNAGSARERIVDSATAKVFQIIMVFQHRSSVFVNNFNFYFRQFALPLSISFPISLGGKKTLV
jgi:hypothetical protein